MPKSASKQIIIYGHRLYKKGFIAGADGNLSIRIKESEIVLTPSGVAKGFLEKEDMVSIDLDGNIISGDRRPSSEMLMHLYVYQHRRDIFACCHAHPPYSTALSIVGKVPPYNLLPEAVLGIGEIALTDYAAPGTKAVGQSLGSFINNHNAFLLKNHGVLTIGQNMEEAYHGMETVEHLSKIFYIAQNIGKLDFLDANEVKRLEEIRFKNQQEKN